MHVSPHLTSQSFLTEENAAKNPGADYSDPCDFTDGTMTRSWESSRLAPDIEVNSVGGPLWVNPDACGNSGAAKS